MKNNKVLVTTGLDATWGTDEDILFLGEWCKNFDERSRYGKRQFSTLPYHWNDAAKLKRDYIYLGELYERILSSLAAALNDHHKVRHSLRYWRIILGPWLLTFVSIIWDRWENLRVAFERDDFDQTIIVSLDKKKLVPNDYRKFVGCFLSDAWNHYIYAEIIKSEYLDKIKITHVSYAGNYSNRWEKVPRGLWKNKILSVMDRMIGLIQKKYKVVFVSSYFGFFPLVKLSLKLRQIPRLYMDFSRPIMVLDEVVDRSPIKFNFEPINAFEKHLAEMLIDQIPICYLEGFEKLNRVAEQIKVDGDIIFTANAHLSNDLFNLWAASKVEAGSKLIVSQHGGGIKQEMIVFLHQENISDKMVVWHQPLESKHVRLSPNKLIDLRVGRRRASELTLVGLETPLYPYRAQTGPKAGGVLEDYDQKITFINHLSPDVRECVRVRSSSYGQGYFNSLTRYKTDLGPAMISPHKTLRQAFQHSSLIVCTYPQTTFSEAMNSGIPTILLISENFWQVDPSFQGLFSELKKRKMIFSDAQLAAEHLNEIWNDLDGWWNSPLVIEGKDKYFAMCGYVQKNWLEEWAGFFKSEACDNKRA